VTLKKISGANWDVESFIFIELLPGDVTVTTKEDYYVSYFKFYPACTLPLQFLLDSNQRGS
jgi:hypothetical protein